MPEQVGTFNNVYQKSRVLVTGHTGFKGTWLSTWLAMLGADVAGFSLHSPRQEIRHTSLNNIHDFRGNIDNFSDILQTTTNFAPDIVFHLAAQSQVRLSYEEPLKTVITNTLGTANVLEACIQTPSVKAAIMITTDKCYENKEWDWGYREGDSLGGYDPYSASKACAEIITASFRNRTDKLIATCRSGNVIGGGDWASDRLVPEMIRSAVSGKAMQIRMPEATRPWLFVLEPLRGYLQVGQKLLEGKREFAEAWNFGPMLNENISVLQFTETAAKYWDKICYQINVNGNTDKHEGKALMLDCGKAYRRLKWKPVWELTKGIEETIRWYKDYYEHNTIRTQQQIEMYCAEQC